MSIKKHLNVLNKKQQYALLKLVKKKITNTEAIEDLKKQFEHHQVMMLKAQGAIEVLEMLEKE